MCFPIFGGVYVLVARAKVIPLTPIRMKLEAAVKRHSYLHLSPDI